MTHSAPWALKCSWVRGKRASQWITGVPLLLRSCRGLDGSQAADFSEGGDALAGGEGDIPGGAVGLAEAALNAPIHQLMRRRGWLEMLQVKVRVLHSKFKFKLEITMNLLI